MTEELKTIDTVDTSPFKKLVMTIGELPTSFVDSMTYYECLAWLTNYIENTVIPAVNNNAEALEELQGLFVQLKSYVDNYFDNLDVQEEINNKLDQMVEDGTMSQLLSGLLNEFRGEIQTEIDAQNTNIENKFNEQDETIENAIERQDNKINSVEAGTLVASSTSDMTDTTRIYINTTDGYWYYYDGTQWTQGGVYQATEIADNSITGDKIKLNTINPFSLAGVPQTPLKTVFKYARWIKNYRYFNGNLVEAEGYVSSLPVPCYQIAGLTYTSLISMTNPERVVTFDNNGTMIAEGAITTSGWTPGTMPYTIAVSLTEADYETYGGSIVTVNYGNDYINIPWLETSNSIDKSILVYGDSLWSNCNGNYNYPSTPYNQSTGPCFGYKQYLESVGMTIDNQGISGTTVVDCWNRTVGKFPQAISAQTLANYDAIIISFGRNDSRTGVPLGQLLPVSTGTYDNNTFYGALQNIISTLLDKRPDLRIILWTATQTNAGGYGTENVNSQGLKQIDYANAMKAVANLYGENVVDMYSESGINELNLERYTFEGVHLTNDGYTFTAQYYLNKMINYLK